MFFQGQQKLVLGVGLNVNTPQEAFGTQLSHTAGSIFSLTGKAIPIERAAEILIRELDCMYEKWQTDLSAFLDEYRQHCVSCQRPVFLIRDGEKKEAFALGIDEDYALVVRYEDGSTQSIKTGEVSLRNL